ncbi:ABC transporter substrate-binding protein [Propylenella binzhouense]|uniref:Iron ABC transporter substrate-binding protein n=1 Tax=Propylenella binzhouense TaxID=2555902 RepID=A0A964T8H8_9HYPH|nr:ABC transporter substrate-binding protein [Propylenella binzhouense]MYZ50473.1 iron ABC transporter substrate-binding protein [Propylenella binzhouense]
MTGRLLRVLGAPLAALLVALTLTRAPAAEITDAAGRAVRVPDVVERVFAAGPPASIVLFTLAPGKLLGWTRALPPAAAAYLPERFRDLPVHGRLTGRGNDINLETVLKLRPDLVVDIGSVGATYASLADRVEAQTGVPALLLGGRLEELPDTYRLLGRILRVEARGEALAAAIESMLGEAARRIASVPPDARPRVYYARGPEGLDTALAGSINVEALDVVGARNVAGASAGGNGLASVSLEQVLAWNPQVIVTVDPVFAAKVGDDPLWSTVAAVRSGRVYLAPQYPFPWVDFPPSVNRVIGVRWLAAILYPDLFPEPLEDLTRSFYALFYQTELGDEDLARLLYRRPG